MLTFSQPLQMVTQKVLPPNTLLLAGIPLVEDDDLEEFLVEDGGRDPQVGTDPMIARSSYTNSFFVMITSRI